MFFDSAVFLFFLAAVLPLGWLLRGRPRRLALLAASNLFYGWWDWRFLALLWASTVLDWAIARAIGRAYAEGRGAKRLISSSILFNLGMLGYFKYAEFFVDSATAALGALGLQAEAWHLDVVLPVGISFYTFQTMSYTIDVYRRQMAPERSLLDVALFVTWFPQLVAGPIERADRLLPQLARDPRFDPDRLSDGAVLLLWGFFQKMVIADRAAQIANAVFGSPAGARSAPEWYLGTLAFAIQIYADFSGYTDIARGVSRLFGVELMLNFQHPYLATGPRDFWRRWHISLSTWLRDYLYVPLGGNRLGPRRTAINLAITMLLGGLWHGAAWHFVLWGAYHGALLGLERALGLDAPRKGHPLVRGFVMFQLTLFGWLLFRIESVGQLGAVLEALGAWSVSSDVRRWLPTLLLLAAPLVLVTLHQLRTGSMEVLAGVRGPGRLLFGALVFSAVLLLRVQDRVEFIYFQF